MIVVAGEHPGDTPATWITGTGAPGAGPPYCRGMDVKPGTIALYADVGCPWASLAVHRIRTRRTALGLDSVRIDHRCFPLELINARPTPKRILEAEIAVIASHEPTLGWRPWRSPEFAYPGTTLLALEAVQAAKDDAVGGLRASEELDAALRQAFYADSRPIHIYSVVVEVARGCAAVAVDALEIALAEGRGRASVFADWQRARDGAVAGSPQIFLADGGTAHNPGLTVSWTGEKGDGFPRIERDDPTVYDDLLRRAVG